MEGRRNKNKEMKNRKIGKCNTKKKYKTSKTHFYNSTIKPTCEVGSVCEKSTFYRLCLAKGAVGV
jgi:hypothetical protein